MQRIVKYPAPLALAAGVAMVAAPACAADEPAPVFDFLGQDTETPTTMTELLGEPCRRKGEELTCNAYGVELAGLYMKHISMSYYHDRLYSVSGAFSNKVVDRMLASFSAKYGAPQTETQVWQNRAGSTFDNQTYAWTFASGNLVLKELGWDLDTAGFEFTSAKNAPPPEPPVVDF